MILRILVCSFFVVATAVLPAGVVRGKAAQQDDNKSEQKTAEKSKAKEQSSASDSSATKADKTSASTKKTDANKAETKKTDSSKAGSTKATQTKGSASKKETAEESRESAIEKARRAAARRRGEITFDDLKFDIEKGGKFERKMLTSDIESLKKRTLRIRGYMFPTFQQEGIQEFVLVRDNQECCFGPGAAIFDCIRVKMEKGKTASFSVRPITVKGKFEIEEFRMPDGFLAAIYKMTAIDVR